ncbi:hypothetical protein QZM46_08420 [Burkholderia vietnamiensis]|jgi:radical SAM superfamily enzyme with C-terminal helix-hairpin-helix motif|uniref:Uncharacterized protein n=5 Tax=Burkholderiaceae TaxID=119060 RepID=A0A0H3KYY0_BURM1|nr:hypothetical protein [Burkholderia vietnamiensis]OXH92464.1 hypothetical protein CA831_02620 [Burkholderia multivorans]OXI35431.1 hypothetical protein CFB84_37210 [Burkholderia aenigmatica]PCD57568.1 hypothetical protein CN645_33210 [Burkholderia sp. IDO3]BAG47628.1 hypothetical protein BMULJ_05819 [Burkholderia multivorans ATCC 17616]MCA7948210.1 hypothetical protein [Burkholderia vietnamiensis]
MQEQMMFDTMRRELSELMQRVKRATEWDTTIACGKVHLDEVSPEALAKHRADTQRIAELMAKYGL